jgi:GGDEF domain-containing protein
MGDEWWKAPLMSGHESEALKNENQLLRLRIAELEDQIESLRRARSTPNFLEDFGLADERYFTRRLHEAVLSASRYARFLCVIQVDVPVPGQNAPGKNNALETAARLREELRQTDLVAYFDSGQILILLEEADPGQALQALRRVTKELVEIPQPNYALACFPNDTNKDETLLGLVSERMSSFQTNRLPGPAVNLGEEIAVLYN